MVVNETSVEVYRGIWLKLSPQLRTEVGDTSAGVWRLGGGLDFFPRTHLHVNLAYYRDRDRISDLVSRTFIAQLHLFL